MENTDVVLLPMAGGGKVTRFEAVSIAVQAIWADRDLSEGVLFRTTNRLANISSVEGKVETICRLLDMRDNTAGSYQALVNQQALPVEIIRHFILVGTPSQTIQVDLATRWVSIWSDQISAPLGNLLVRAMGAPERVTDVFGPHCLLIRD